jgi:hypothetical protein
MTKKMIAAWVALVALAAVALPAAASAQNRPSLVEGGVTVAVGTPIVATPTGETYFNDTSGNHLLTCVPAGGTTRLTGTLTKNSSTTVEAEITTADLAGTGTKVAVEPEPECTGSFGNFSFTVPGKLQLKSTPLMATDEFQINAVGSTKVKFILNTTTVGECEYESAGPIKGDITTSATTAAVTVRNTLAGSGSKLIRGGFLCASSLQLQWTFHLETENGISLGIVEAL